MKRILLVMALWMASLSLTAQEWEVSVEEMNEGYIGGMVTVDGGECVLVTGTTHGPFNPPDAQDGLVVKVAKDGSYISRKVHMPGMILAYHCAEQLPNGNYMVFGVCNDSLMDPAYQRYLKVDVFDAELQTISSRIYDVNDDVFECFIRPYTREKMASMVSKSGTVILSAVLAYPESTLYGIAYAPAFRFYEFDEDGNVIRFVDDAPNLVASGAIKRITYAPHSDNIVVILKGGVYPEGHTGCSGMFVFDTAFHVVARQHMLGLASPFGIVNDNASDGRWIDGEYLILDIEKRYGGKPYRSLFKVDSALHVYATVDLLPLDDSCTQAPPGTTTAYVDDSTIFEFSFSRITMMSSSMQQANINLVDKDLNLLGRKVIRQDDRFNQFSCPAAFNDGGCLVWFTSRKPDNTEQRLFFTKYRREDIEITWDVVKEEKVDKVCAYPNPATHTVNIPIGDRVCEGGRLQVFDMKGAKCLDSAIAKQGNLITLDVQNLEAGMYVYKVVLRNQETISGKFVKE